MSCENGCLEISVRCCESPVIQLELLANTAFSVHINKPGSNRWYLLNGTTNNTGAVTLDKTKFPDGFFATGYLKGEFLDSNNSVLPFTVDNTEYKCFLLELVDTIEL
jgi:hypothetical protein